MITCTKYNILNQNNFGVTGIPIRMNDVKLDLDLGHESGTQHAHMPSSGSTYVCKVLLYYLK